MNKNKKNNIEIDDFFMGMALMMTAKAQSAAIITNAYNEFVSCGVNGVPQQYNEFNGNLVEFEERHAEMVALADVVVGTTIYVTNRVCWNCTLEIISKNIKRIVYYPIGEIKESEMEKIDKVAKGVYLTIVKYDGNLNWLRDKIKFIENNNK